MYFFLVEKFFPTKTALFYFKYSFQLPQWCGGVAMWTGCSDGPEEGPGPDSLLMCLACHKLARPPPALLHTCSQVASLQQTGEGRLKGRTEYSP